MRNEKDPASGGLAVLMGLGGLGGIMARSEREIDRFTFCEDCENFSEFGDSRYVGPPRRLCTAMSTLRPVEASFVHPSGPLWPGCRGFKHKPGTPGPEKRWRDHVKAEQERVNAEFEKMKERIREQESAEAPGRNR